MKIEVLLQGEGIADIQRITLPAGTRIRDLVSKIGGDPDGVKVFEQDAEEALSMDQPVPDQGPGKATRLHIHRCHRVVVTVQFNGKTKDHPFPPSRTVDSVKRFMAEKKFDMAPADAAEHILQITGTNTRPEPDTQIGALTGNPSCAVAFDLVPLKRVEG